MQITSLNTKTGAAKGAFLHLKHPALGHRMWTGEGADELGRLVDKEKAQKVGCTVIGTESEQVREQARAMQKKKMKAKEDEEEDDDTGLAFVCSLVTEFVGLEDSDGKPLKANEEGKRDFFGQSDGLVEQVLGFASDRGNFFSGGSTA